MSFRPLPEDSGFDLYELNREFDRTKTAAFVGDNGAFLGPLMCGMEFIWTLDVETAATDGIRVWWNPTDFLQLSSDLRKSTLLHELWHPANLHFVRQGDRNPQLWNIACDYDINNNLRADGYKVEKPYFIWDDRYRGWAVEDIYDDIKPKGSGGNLDPKSGQGQGAPDPDGGPGKPDQSMPKGGTTGHDMAPQASPEDTQRAINNVIQAAHTAIASGNPGAVPGSVMEVINKFLSPVVPWETLLERFCEDRFNDDYSYHRPNRRFPDVYMPSLNNEGRLVHGAVYQDVSGSVSTNDSIRFNSELKAIKERFNPEQMTIVQFDTKIQQIDTLTEDDEFTEIKIVGRGGTCLKCVRQHIMDTEPDFAIIFSDMLVRPMEPGPKCPILWVAVGNPNATVPFGTLIHVDS